MKFKKCNNIYYECGKKKGCKGSIKYNYLDKKLYIINICDNNVIHDTCFFETFYDNYLKDNLINYNMTYINFQ